MFRGRLAEFTLHIINFVYFCGGVVILVLGAVALGSPSSIINVMSYIPRINNLSQVMQLSGIATGPSIYLIVEGSLVIILSFVGCGGAFKRKIPIVATFGIFTLLMMLFNLAIIMYYMIEPNAIKGTVQYNMNQSLTNAFEPTYISSTGVVSLPSNYTSPSSYSWNLMQSTQSCCGVNGYTDYQDVIWFNNTYYAGLSNVNAPVAAVPASCCMTNVFGQLPDQTSDFVNITGCLNSGVSGYPQATYMYTQGCVTFVMSQITEYNFVWSVAAAGFTGLQAIIICLSLWLLVTPHHKAGLV